MTTLARVDKALSGSNLADKPFLDRHRSRLHLSRTFAG